jgi:hypothetical protein
MIQNVVECVDSFFKFIIIIIYIYIVNICLESFYFYPLMFILVIVIITYFCLPLYLSECFGICWKVVVFFVFDKCNGTCRN